VLDDFIAGAMLFWSAMLMRRPTLMARRFLSAAWGVAMWMLYGSFVLEFIDPVSGAAIGVPFSMVTLLVGLAFLVSVACFIASVFIPDANDARTI
jgi:hypothetical protein